MFRKIAIFIGCMGILIPYAQANYHINCPKLTIDNAWHLAKNGTINLKTRVSFDGNGFNTSVVWRTDPVEVRRNLSFLSQHYKFEDKFEHKNYRISSVDGHCSYEGVVGTKDLKRAGDTLVIFKLEIASKKNLLLSLGAKGYQPSEIQNK